MLKSLGKKDDIVDVKEGYARTFLFTKNLGVPADAKNMNEVKLRKARETRLQPRSWLRPKSLRKSWRRPA